MPSFKIWKTTRHTQTHTQISKNPEKNIFDETAGGPDQEFSFSPLLFFLRIAEGCCCCCFVSFCLSRKSRTAQRDRNGKKLLDRADVWGERERGGSYWRRTLYVYLHATKYSFFCVDIIVLSCFAGPFFSFAFRDFRFRLEAADNWFVLDAIFFATSFFRWWWRKKEKKKNEKDVNVQTR